MRLRALSTLAVTLLALGCQDTSPPETTGPTRPPGIYAEPMRLAFLCVTPGCDTTLPVRVNVAGSRRVAIKRILLADDAGGDFSFSSSEAPPFVVGGNAGFDLEVRYQPKGAPLAGAVRLLVTYTDASPEESEDRLPPGELEIPLVRRVVGEPVLTATPEALQFGVVQPNEQRTLALRLSNDGFGNVALTIARADAGHAAFSASIPADPSMMPGKGLELPITFAPTGEGYVKSSVVIAATSSDLLPLSVDVEGTSLSTARLAVEPQGDVDFGEVKRGKSRTVSTTLLNQGGQELIISSLQLIDPSGNLSVSTPDGGTGIILPPLGRAALTFTLDGKTPGELDSMLRFSTTDPQRPLAQLRLTGTVTEPQVTLTPTSIDFGTVPMGWVLTRPVEIRNTGYGPLTVKNITLVSGSSTLYTVTNLPALPLSLPRDGRVGVDVQFRGESTATFNGFLSVETDDPLVPFAEVPLKATVGTCQDACPIANGTASCAAGTCAVGSCNSGYFDTDGKPATGCECKELGVDPGGFCSNAKDVGTLKDTDKATASHAGRLPELADVDVFRFFAQDDFSWFDDNYNVKIRLDSADPTIRLCVYRYPTGSHQSDCYWVNESCPSSRYYSKGSSGTGDDGADFIVKVHRTASSAAATCTSYTLFMSNGD